ncbi:hypothetical protein H9P43_002984 [Blastocladiella emersonii ATCC 22665]|nr:hypothetical protein H9P43_002984 [Blastocladiella emersonii ATCC 22665]
MVATRAPSTPSGYDKRRAFARQANSCATRSRLHGSELPSDIARVVGPDPGDAARPLGQPRQASTVLQNTRRGLAARVVAGLKHAPGCTCESEFEFIQYVKLQRQGSPRRPPLWGARGRAASTSYTRIKDWNLKYKLGIKDIEAFDKEALQTIRKPFKEKTEWVDLVQAAADNSCIITNKVGEKESLTKQWLVGEAPKEPHRATLAMVDEHDDAELDMDFADTDLDAAMSVRACRGAHPLYVSFLDRLLFGQANDMATARGSNQSSHGTALLTKSHSIPSLTFRTVVKRMAGYAIVNDLKLLDINKPFSMGQCAWRITGSAYQQGIIVGLTKEDAKVTLADYYDAFLVSRTGSVSVAKRIYLASQLRVLFKRGILNVSLAEIAQQNTRVETTKTQAAMTVDIANDICPDE